MERFKKCEIILLDVENSNYAIDKQENELVTSFTKFDKSKVYEPIQLYIVSRHTICKGDWYVNIKTRKISNNIDEILDFDICNKIIASTDKKLGLPILPQTFITHYIESYNNDCVVIENVTILMDRMLLGKNSVFTLEPVVDKNNHISIINETLCTSFNDMPIEIIENMITYIDEKQLYDKLASYNDFYYKAVKWINKIRSTCY